MLQVVCDCGRVTPTPLPDTFSTVKDVGCQQSPCRFPKVNQGLSDYYSIGWYCPGCKSYHAPTCQTCPKNEPTPPGGGSKP